MQILARGVVASQIHANSPIPKSDGTWFIKTHFIVHSFGKNPMSSPNHTQIQCVKSAQVRAWQGELPE
jgi:hypothetical protein